jgi:glutathione S-transferase
VGQYTIYGGELSYFSRKLEAALIFYGADYEFKPKQDPSIEARSGTHQVPVLHTPENWMIGDTTPLLRMLDGRYPARAMFPSNELGVLVHVLEEHFDEWLARTMVHYRWHYPESAEFASMRMAGGNREAAQRVLSWGPRACRATGTESAQQRQAAEDEYVRILEAAEAQLKDTAFLLGDRPTALDCIVLGGLRAHTNMDPVPKRVVAGYPTVVDWAERRADDWDGAGELAPFPASTPFAQHVLGEMPTTYKRYALANRDAQMAGATAFHTEIYGEDVSYLSRPYPEQSRQMLIERIDNLDSDARVAVNTWLVDQKLADAFA